MREENRRERKRKGRTRNAGKKRCEKIPNPNNSRAFNTYQSRYSPNFRGYIELELCGVATATINRFSYS